MPPSEVTTWYCWQQITLTYPSLYSPGMGLRRKEPPPFLKMFLSPQNRPVRPVKTRKKLESPYLSLFLDRHPSGHPVYAAGYYLFEHFC
jgi:hypothetical protein